MATLQPRSFSAIVQMIAAGVQGRARTVLDYSIGSTLRAIAEGHAGVALWIQGLILKLLLTTRASTSSGADLDTWVNDFGVFRLAAIGASGYVNFVRFTGSETTPFIPVGATVETADGTQAYAVVADPGNPIYSTGQFGYTMPAYTTSVTLPVKALAAGYATNAMAGSVSVLTSGLVGIDEVMNPADLLGGVDAESDQALRVRFQFFIASLSKATAAAIIYAVKSLQFGAQCTLTEFETYEGVANPGFFYATIDDGSGVPTTELLTAAGAAIQEVRPLTVQFAIFPPVIIYVTVTMRLVSFDGYDHNDVIGNVGIAVRDYINTLQLGESLSYTKIMQVAFNADPGVQDIIEYRLSGGVSDIVAANKNVIKTNQVTVV